MNRLLKNWLFQNKSVAKAFVLIPVFSSKLAFTQVANYISNGSFEDKYDCAYPLNLYKIKFWMAVDSNGSYSAVYRSDCNGTIPGGGGNDFQYARTGQTFVLSTFYYPQNYNGRGYLKNRLKSNLIAGKTYCVRMHVNIRNGTTYGNDGFGIYFGGNLIDTIVYCNRPLSFISPQVSNPTGNVITDTLNWVLISGTFVAQGNEKYALIGNFKPNGAVDSALVNPTNLPTVATDVLIDDVSCIDVDLPAYAGPDKFAINGTTVYIGRPKDVGIDEACTWYQVPSPFPFANAAGVTVPVTPGTQTFVVKQEICGNIKYDTVLVHESFAGLEDLQRMRDDVKVFPVPAGEEIYLSYTQYGLEKEFKKAEILNSIGQLVIETDLNFSDKKAPITVKDLPPGLYTLKLSSSLSGSISRRFVVKR